jgi:hypothetical protein
MKFIYVSPTLYDQLGTFMHLRWDCDPSLGVRCEIFHLWHFVSSQELLDFVAFQLWGDWREMAKVVEYLPSKLRDLSSNPNTTKNKAVALQMKDAQHEFIYLTP